MADDYRGYNVLDKWATPSFDAPTRNVIERRLHVIPERRFFAEDEWRLLDAVAARLIPQPDRASPIPMTPWIDQMLADDVGEGFRFDGEPKMQVAWQLGLAGIEAEARRRFGDGFATLEAASQDRVLEAVQRGDVEPSGWPGLNAERFFRHDLLKTVAGVYYAHPDAWSEIGFGGPASPRGYVRLGFDECDPWEAQEAK
jgi:hypothetical protein